MLVEAGVPAGPINSVAEALADPQVQANGMLLEMEHPKTGTVRATGNPMRMSAGRTSVDVSEVSGEERTEEIARMLGGSKGSEKRLALAAEMLNGRRPEHTTRTMRP